MNCPICNHSEISEGTTTCPACGSDIETFAAINHLDKQVKRLKQTVIALIVLCIAGVLVLTFAYTKLKGKTELILKQYQDINGLIQEEAALNAANQDLKQKLSAKGEEEKSSEPQRLSQTEKQAEAPAVAIKISAPETGEFSSRLVKVKYNESLWIIAEREYGDGFKFTKIAQDNNIQNPDMLFTGAELIIRK